MFFGKSVYKRGQAFVMLLLFLLRYKDSHSYNNKITGKARPPYTNITFDLKQLSYHHEGFYY